MERLISLDNIRSSTLHTAPYEWALIENAIAKEFRDELILHFPDKDFQTIERSEGTKNYRMSLRPFIKMDEAEGFRINDLHPLWKKFYDEVTSTQYIQVMEELTGKNLSQCYLEATFWRYYPSCYLSPHTDESEKCVTHLFYFNKNWDVSSGGGLEIYGKDLKNGPQQVVVPNDDNSVVLVRSDSSWHAVPSVAPHYNRERLSLQIVFWNNLRSSKRAYAS